MYIYIYRFSSPPPAVYLSLSIDSQAYRKLLDEHTALVLSRLRPTRFVGRRRKICERVVV